MTTPVRQRERELANELDCLVASSAWSTRSSSPDPPASASRLALRHHPIDPAEARTALVPGGVSVSLQSVGRPCAGRAPTRSAVRSARRRGRGRSRTMPVVGSRRRMPSLRATRSVASMTLDRRSTTPSVIGVRSWPTSTYGSSGRQACRNSQRRAAATPVTIACGSARHAAAHRLSKLSGDVATRNTPLWTWTRTPLVDVPAEACSTSETVGDQLVVRVTMP